MSGMPNDPRDNFNDICIPGQTRWALRIRGTDGAGQPRLLAIDWDGDIHNLNPDTGMIRRPAASYAAGETAIHFASGKKMIRADGCTLLCSPPKIRWIAMAEDGGGNRNLLTDEMMEDVR